MKKLTTLFLITAFLFYACDSKTECGDNELFTILLTVDKNNKIIDKLEITYDEIAESAFGKPAK